jgi:hypothetical protein
MLRFIIKSTYHYQEDSLYNKEILMVSGDNFSNYFSAFKKLNKIYSSLKNESKDVNYIINFIKDYLKRILV